MQPLLRELFLIATVFLLLSCGHKGKLSLPDKETPEEVIPIMKNRQQQQQ